MIHPTKCGHSGQRSLCLAQAFWRAQPLIHNCKNRFRDGVIHTNLCVREHYTLFVNKKKINHLFRCFCWMLYKIISTCSFCLFLIELDKCIISIIFGYIKQSTNILHALGNNRGTIRIKMGHLGIKFRFSSLF